MIRMDNLYRGKSADGKWHEGYLFVTASNAGLTPNIQVINNTSYTTFEVNFETVGQYSGLTDIDGVKIFENDLRIDPNGNVFRVYSAPGGFVIKQSIWRNNIKGLQWDDDFILQPLANLQTATYICQKTKHYGNIHEIKYE